MAIKKFDEEDYELELVSANEEDKPKKPNKVKDSNQDDVKEVVSKDKEEKSKESINDEDISPSEIKEDLISKDQNEVRRKKKSTKEIKNTKNKTKVNKEELKSINVGKIMILSAGLFGLIYYIYYIIISLNSVDYFQNIINASLMLTAFELLILTTFVKKKLKEMFLISASSIVIIFLIFNIVIKANIFKAPSLAVLKDYTSASIIEVINDCKENKIDLIKNYEYSDNVLEGNVISQSVLPNTVLKDIDELTVIVSSGPNYDKEVMLTDFVGLTLDDLIKFIDDNKLSNVTMNFDANNTVAKEIVVSQSTIGKIKRNQSITFNISLGSAEGLSEIKLDDLTGKSLFDSTLYLKRNGIKYEIVYEFSKDVEKDYVIKQNKEVGDNIKPLSDTVILTVSKGEEIKVPSFSGKTSDDVLNWIVKNNLLVEFVEKYDVKVSIGGLIGINYNEGDSITEGTKITIYTSLGPVVVPTFKSLGEFRTWAQNNNIKYSETYAYNDTVAKGSIVKLSVPSGTSIDPTKTSIEVTVSQGRAVIVPYFINKSKSEIQTLCRNVGLNCTFYYTGYSSTAADHATKQNLSSGARVVSGTYVNIGLSSGQPKTYKVYIQGEWFQTTADNTIAVLKAELAKVAPGVYFNYVKKASNTGFSGQIHENSPTKGGVQSTFVQGNTYTIWVIS